jgi:hypothetical protein
VLDAKKLARTAQIQFPAFLEAMLAAQQDVRTILRRPLDPELELLAAFPTEPPSTQSVWLDIGASRGRSIEAMRLYDQSVGIIAFEPHPLLARHLAARFARDPMTSIRKTGLSDAAGECVLHVPAYGGGASWARQRRAVHRRAWFEAILRYRSRIGCCDSASNVPDADKVGKYPVN